MNVRFWVCAAMTLLSATVSAGFSIAALSGHNLASVVTQYCAARSVALLVSAAVVVALRSRSGTLALGFTMMLVQAFDAAIGAAGGDPVKTFGPIAFAVFSAVSLVWLFAEQPIRESVSARS